MRTGSSFESLDLLCAEGVLLFEPRFLDPGLPSGLWFCDGPETVQTVQMNAVCLAQTAGWEDLTRCAAFFRPFPYIVIVSPDPAQRRVMIQELRRRVADTIFYVATDKAFRGCKTVRELRDTHGLSGVEEILMDVVEMPAYGLLNLADVKAPDPAQMEHVLSGIPILDRKVGGFYMGEVSIWTGRRGEGKSTLLGQLLLNAIDQDNRVCAYSGELRDWKFKYWTSLQAAGPSNIVERKDPRTGRPVPAVPEDVQRQIDAWLDRRFLLYDIGASAFHDADNILRLFAYAKKFYGCNVFLVDNIMTARFRQTRDKDYYRAQSNFVEALCAFARSERVHIHVVAHPRKGQSGSRKHLESDDVGGIGDITNLADNVFSLERAVRQGGRGENPVEDVTSLAILKNRMWGDTTPKDQAIGLQFEKRCKRFYRKDCGVDRRYGWDVCKQMTMEELPGKDPELPFEEGSK